MLARRKFECDGIEHRGHHLACHGALPDKRIQPELFVIQLALQHLGRACNRGRADGFVRLLCVLGFGLEGARLVRHVLGAVALRDDFANLGDRNIGQGHRIGAHVTDETDIAFARQLDAFIKTLRNAHRPLGVESKLARCFLLQCRRRKRCGRIASALFFLDADGRQLATRLVENGSFNFACRVLVAKTELFDFLAFVSNETRGKRLLVLADVGFDRPVLARLECLDLELALDDHAQRRALYPAGRQSALYFFPQQR